MYKEKAIRHYEEGRAFQQTGKLLDAERSYQKATKISPKFVEAHNNLGNVLIDMKRLKEASVAYRKALKIHPSHPMLLNNLGNVLQLRGEYKTAISWLNKAIAEQPNYADAYNNLGNALAGQGEPDSAITAYRKAIQFDPRHKQAYDGLGATLSDQGEFDKAISTYREAINIFPDSTQAYLSLSMIKTFSEYDGDIRAMESLYSRKGISDKKKMNLAFGLGKAFEDFGEYERAIEFFMQATHLKRASFDYSIFGEQEKFCKLKEVFSPEFFSDRRGIGDPDQTPIFILGMPRSGTSLVEQIVASHPDVFGAGELTDIIDLTEVICGTGSRKKYPECIAGLESGIFKNFGKQYVTSIRKHSENTKFITDKFPHNFLHIGFIKAILPNAKIIHLVRDPMDNCLSLFKNDFAKGQYYSYDMTELGQYYNLYLEMMEHWRNTLPDFIYDLSYEKLVSNQEEQTRRLLEFCNLSWDESCLDFHKTRRTVKTASNAQVRRPIYKESIKLWKRYEKKLKPLLTAIYG